MISKQSLFKQALPVLNRLIDAGYEAYFVGGSVRDAVLNKDISDIDIATSATPEEVKTVFHYTFDVGIEHGTVLVLEQGVGYEVTTFRTEEGYSDYRHPSSVTFVKNLKEDLKRRDFTINALALSAEGVLIDYFDGQEDLKRRLIRCVGDACERFSEDALRMFRAIRFVAQLDFSLDQETKQALIQLAPLLEKIAVERLRVEWLKTLTGINRSEAILLFLETNLYQYCPLFRDKRQELERFATACKLEQLTQTQAWIAVCFYLQLTEEQATDMLKAWKCSNKEIQATRIGLNALKSRKEASWDFTMLYGVCDELAEEVESMVALVGKQPDYAFLKSVQQQLPIRSMKDIAVNGNDVVKLLQLQQKGKVIGDVLKEIENRILKGTLKNNYEDLAEFIRQFKQEV